MKPAGWLEKIGEVIVSKHFCAMAKIEKNRVLKHILLWGVAWFLLILFFTEGWEDPLRLLYRGLPVICF